MNGAETLSKIQTEISDIEKNGGDMVPLAKVKEMMTVLRDILGDDDGAHTTTAEIYSEVGQLAIFLNGARKELANIGGVEAGDKMTEASAHLTEAVEMAEKSTNIIMAAAEKIQEVTAGTPAADEVSKLTTEIFEACNFQDITGQRIYKVRDVLKKLEQIVLRLIMVFGSSVDMQQEVNPEKDLMSGPALKGEGLEQGGVDDILDKIAEDAQTATSNS